MHIVRPRHREHPLASDRSKRRARSYWNRQRHPADSVGPLPTASWRGHARRTCDDWVCHLPALGSAGRFVLRSESSNWADGKLHRCRLGAAMFHQAGGVGLGVGVLVPSAITSRKNSTVPVRTRLLMMTPVMAAFRGRLPRPIIPSTRPTIGKTMNPPSANAEIRPSTREATPNPRGRRTGATPHVHCLGEGFDPAGGIGEIGAGLVGRIGRMGSGAPKDRVRVLPAAGLCSGLSCS